MYNSLPYWSDTVTIINKCSYRDNSTNKDIWQKTILQNCFFKRKFFQENSGTDVKKTYSFVCRIPQNSNYKSYLDWIKDTSNGFTLSVGDYIFYGVLEETVNAENIPKIINKYKDSIFLIKTVSENTKLFGLGKHYRVEG